MLQADACSIHESGWGWRIAGLLDRRQGTCSWSSWSPHSAWRAVVGGHTAAGYSRHTHTHDKGGRRAPAPRRTGAACQNGVQMCFELWGCVRAKMAHTGVHMGAWPEPHGELGWTRRGRTPIGFRARSAVISACTEFSRNSITGLAVAPCGARSPRIKLRCTRLLRITALHTISVRRELRENIAPART